MWGLLSVSGVLHNASLPHQLCRFAAICHGYWVWEFWEKLYSAKNIICFINILGLILKKNYRGIVICGFQVSLIILILAAFI
jgi:hypothetical protein